MTSPGRPFRSPLGALALLALLSLWTRPASATSDDGRIARLLAFGGPAQRYAIVAEVPFQSWCPKDACDLLVYAVDMTASRFALLEPRVLPGHTYYGADDVLDGDALARRYAALAGKPLGVTAPSLGPPTHAVALLPYGTDALKGRRSDGTWLVVDHLRVAELASMSATDHHSARSCVEHVCSTCRDTTRSIDGRRATARRCSAEDGRWSDGGGTCRCDAAGAMVALRVGEAGAKGDGPGLFLGRHAAVEPYQLATNVALAERAKETIDVAVTAPRFSAWETDAGAVVVTGALAHDPFGNGTLFPVVAILPPGRRVTPSVDLTDPPPSGASSPKPVPPPPPSTASPLPSATSPEPPPVPPPTGCGGCSLDPTPVGVAAWWWLAAALAWQRRRRAS
ncbi:MAG: hypothetical protein R3B72_44670 [Polyangiaceae bacterium]